MESWSPRNYTCTSQYLYIDSKCNAKTHNYVYYTLYIYTCILYIIMTTTTSEVYNFIDKCENGEIVVNSYVMWWRHTSKSKKNNLLLTLELVTVWNQVVWGFFDLNAAAIFYHTHLFAASRTPVVIDDWSRYESAHCREKTSSFPTPVPCHSHTHH